jgi:hypothetical protein
MSPGVTKRLWVAQPLHVDACHNSEQLVEESNTIQGLAAASEARGVRRHRFAVRCINKNRHVALSIIPSFGPRGLLDRLHDVSNLAEVIAIISFVSDPMDGLHVSLDAFTLDIASGKRKIQAIDSDGTLIFEEPYA